MNCRSAQEKIVDAMASRELGLREDLDQHVRECAGCRASLASHASLASAIDSHLRLIANEPVPPSLLLGVRARLEQEAAPRQWIFSWRFAVATVVVLLVATVIGMRDSDKPGRPKETTAKVAHGSPDVNRPPTVSSQIQLPAPKASRFAAAARKTSIPAHSSTPEVLVLPEERQAFRRFVSDISKDRASTNALVSAALDSGDGPVEIALLAIENVEIKPLEGTDSE